LCLRRAVYLSANRRRLTLCVRSFKRIRCPQCPKLKLDLKVDNTHPLPSNTLSLVSGDLPSCYTSFAAEGAEILDISVTYDGRASLDEPAFQSGQIKFRCLLPDIACTSNEARVMQ
jgi:hypothetical protein